MINPMLIPCCLVVAILGGCSAAQIKEFDRHYRNESARIDAEPKPANPMLDSMRQRQGVVAPNAPSSQPDSKAAAVWTGRSHSAQSVTGTIGLNCEYSYAGRSFWRMFASSCPSSVQVQ